MVVQRKLINQSNTQEEVRLERARLVVMKNSYRQVESEAKAQQEYLNKKIEELDNEIEH